MVKAAYIDGKTGLLFFQKENIVYRTLETFKHFLEPNGPLRYEWELWGLNPAGQPYGNEMMAHDLAEKLEHPQDCVMDVDATIESLKLSVLDGGIILTMRNRKSHEKTKKIYP